MRQILSRLSLQQGRCSQRQQHNKHNRRDSSRRKGAEVKTWSGTNVTPSAAIGADGTTYSVIQDATEWDLSITTREAGTIKTITIDRTIETNSTTNSYSIFAISTPVFAEGEDTNVSNPVVLQLVT